MHLEAYSVNTTVSPRNTDGFDPLRSSNVIVQNSIVHNTDDCVSFKPSSSAVIIQGLQCNGSHGISVGSLGQYLGEVDIVENLYIYNISMSNASDGARLKVWPGVVPGDNRTNVGGGLGYVKNVTYHDFRVSNDDWSIQIDQCYGQNNKTLCHMYPSSMTMSDVLFKDLRGTTSKRNDPRVGQLICSAPEARLPCFSALFLSPLLTKLSDTGLP
jgi:galacturan 1,4-alpha-galacturonidase